VAEVAPSRPDISAEMAQARLTFARLLADASPADLHRGSRGTRWTNEQLLFHMLFGYLIVRALLPLVKLMGRLPDPVSVRFARLLDALAAPFHAINYRGSCAGAVVFGHRRMRRRMDAVIMSPQRHLARETDESMVLRKCRATLVSGYLQIHEEGQVEGSGKLDSGGVRALPVDWCRVSGQCLFERACLADRLGGEVDPGDLPTEMGQPEAVAAFTAGEVQGSSGRECGDLLLDPAVRFRSPDQVAVAVAGVPLPGGHRCHGRSLISTAGSHARDKKSFSIFSLSTESAPPLSVRHCLRPVAMIA